MSAAPDDITCKELVELVTDYLDVALSAADLARFEAHREICDACRDYVDQVKATVSATGAVRPDTIDESTREALLESFRGWKRESGL